MRVNVKEIEKELYLETGDLVVLQDGSTRILVNDWVYDKYSFLCTESGHVYSVWQDTIEELLSVFSDNPIVRVIPSSKLELREID